MSSKSFARILLVDGMTCAVRLSLGDTWVIRGVRSLIDRLILMIRHEIGIESTY